MKFPVSFLIRTVNFGNILKGPDSVTFKVDNQSFHYQNSGCRIDLPIPLYIEKGVDFEVIPSDGVYLEVTLAAFTEGS